MVLQSFESGRAASLANWRGLLADGSIFPAVIGRTVLVAGVSAAIAVSMGYVLAYVAYRSGRVASAVILLFVGLPYLTPALTRTYAWKVLLSDTGPVLTVLRWLGIEAGIQLLYAMPGVVIGTSQVLLPIAVFPLYALMRRVNRWLPLAAQSLGANSTRAWRTTFWPVTRAGTLGTYGLVFVIAFGYYTTPVVLAGVSTPILAQSLGSQIQRPGSAGSVAAQGSAVLLFAAAAAATLLFFRKLLRAARSRPSMTGQFEAAAVLSSPGGAAYRLKGSVARRLLSFEALTSYARWPVLYAGAAAILALLVAPVIVVFMIAFEDSNFLTFPPQAYSTRWFAEYFHSQEWLRATSLSVQVAGIATAACLVTGLLGAVGMSRGQMARVRVLSAAAFSSPLVMPQIIFAAGLFYAFNATNLAGTPLALIIAYSAMALPIATGIISVGLNSIDRTYERAAASLGAAPGRVIVTILLPLLSPAMLGAGLLCFFTMIDDLVVAQFVGGQDTVTLTWRIYMDLNDELSPLAFVVGVLVVGLAVAGTLVSLLVFRRRRRLETAARSSEPTL
jgi:putative spermidine/putrescine transport system permease protein